MASPSETGLAAATSIEAPYRDDPNDVESTPLLVDEEAAASRPQPATDEEQATTASQPPADGGAPNTPRRQFNYIRFHRATLILGVVVLVDLIGFLVFAGVGQDIGFHLPGHFEEFCGKTLVWGLITVVWASIAVHRHRKKQPHLSFAWSTLVHGILAFFIFGTAAESSYVLDMYPGLTCWGHRDGQDQCEILSQVFWWFCLVYVAVLFVLSILQCILFVACLTATYRRQLYHSGTGHGFSLPGGQISIEFSIRFLRQDAPPSPAPIRGVSPPSPAPVLASAQTQTTAPASATGPLIATD